VRHWDSVECDWEREKQKILTALVDSTGESLDFMQDAEVANHFLFIQYSMLNNIPMSLSSQ